MVTPAGAAPEPIYAVRGLSVEYPSRRGDNRVLQDIDFTVADGEFVAICGPSGTGKTTLLRALAGLVPLVPDSSVRFQDVPVLAPPAGVVMVFQNYSASLFPWRTVARNVALGLEGRMSRDEARVRVFEALALVGLESRALDYPTQLSGGMQQRVQIARALATRPRVLLMDEPFGALDAMTKQSMQDELLRLASTTGTTIVFITHDVDEAVYLADRVLVINDSPATITTSVEIPLARPRDQMTTKESPEYLRLRHRVHEAIHGR